MNDDEEGLDWFREALEDATMEAEKRRLMRGKVYHALGGGFILPPVKTPPRPREAAAALSELERARATGVMHAAGANGPTVPTHPKKSATISPRTGLEAIMTHIRFSKDPRKKASEWLVKFSNEIHALTKELDDDDDQG